MNAKKKPAVPPGSGVSDPETMTPEQLAVALKNTYILEMWINAVRAHAFDVLKEGGTVPGFKLGYGVKRRIWKDGCESNLVKKLMAKASITHDEIYTAPELISPAKMEALLKEKDCWPAKPRGGERPPTLIDEFIDYSMPEPRVMPADAHGDDKPAKLREAASEFKS